VTKLGKVFGDGADAMGKIAGSLRGLDLDDLERVKAAASPHLKPAKAALDAVKAIAKAPAKVSIGGSIGSPEPMPGDTTMPRGVQGVVTLTFWF
jgi:hypothetical protein